MQSFVELLDFEDQSPDDARTLQEYVAWVGGSGQAGAP